MLCRPARDFSDAVKRVLPRARPKRLSCAFDCRGPDVALELDAVALECSLFRLMGAAVDLLHFGRLAFDAEVRVTRPGRCRIEFHLFGTGVMAGEAALSSVIERLDLQEDRPSGDRHDAPGLRPDPSGELPEGLRLRRARGHCPRTGAAIELAALPSGSISIKNAFRAPTLRAANHGPGPRARRPPLRPHLPPSSRTPRRTLP